MRALPTAFALLFLLFAHTTLAGTPSPALAQEADRLFRQGNEAFARGETAAAIGAYAKVLALGVESPELNYDLGTAYLKENRTGLATLYLLRSHRAAPRDPAIRQNLALAVRESRASVPDAPWYRDLLGRLSAAEWRSAAVGFYWLAVLMLAVILAGRFRRPAAVLLAVSAAGLLVSVAGIRSWNGSESHALAVVVSRGQQGYLAPTAASRTISLSEGSQVRIRETAQGWLRVEASEGTAWVPAEAVERVLPD